MDENTNEIHVTKVLSSSIIVDLLENYPNLEKITCSPSVYKRTSDNYIDALKRLNIDVSTEYRWGNSKKKYDYEEELLRLADEGCSALEISKKLNINLNNVYYLLRRNNIEMNNYKKKHDYDEVKSLNERGLKPAKISEKLNIPLRTVYYILNKK